MSIIIGGKNNYHQISQNSNQKEIHAPEELNFIFPDISYSVYSEHSIAVGADGTPYAVGNNDQWTMYANLGIKIKKWRDFQITTRDKRIHKVQSAVCGLKYTLYLLEEPFKKSEGGLYQLALVVKNLKNGYPVFLSTHGQKIVGIYGGKDISAAIDENGGIHIIIFASFQTGKTFLKYLPSSDIPVYIAFQEKYVIALSSHGKVYHYNLGSESDYFQIVPELIDLDIVWISGVADHCLVVDSKGTVYGRGSNESRQLCNKGATSNFVNIKALNSQFIVRAYAGSTHSLFQNREGRVFAIGSNSSGEALQANGTNEKILTILKPTVISEGATYCITGCNLSVAFVNQNPPANSPNLILEIGYKRMYRNFGNENISQKEIDDMKNQIFSKDSKIQRMKTWISELKNEIKELKEKESSQLNKKILHDNQKPDKSNRKAKQKNIDDDSDYYEYNSENEITHKKRNYSKNGRNLGHDNRILDKEKKYKEEEDDCDDDDDGDDHQDFKNKHYEKEVQNKDNEDDDDYEFNEVHGSTTSTSKRINKIKKYDKIVNEPDDEEENDDKNTEYVKSGSDKNEDDEDDDFDDDGDDDDDYDDNDICLFVI